MTVGGIGATGSLTRCPPLAHTCLTSDGPHIGLAGSPPDTPLRSLLTAFAAFVGVHRGLAFVAGRQDGQPDFTHASISSRDQRMRVLSLRGRGSAPESDIRYTVRAETLRTAATCETSISIAGESSGGLKAAFVMAQFQWNESRSGATTGVARPSLAIPLEWRIDRSMDNDG